MSSVWDLFTLNYLIQIKETGFHIYVPFKKSYYRNMAITTLSAYKHTKYETKEASHEGLRLAPFSAVYFYNTLP